MCALPPRGTGVAVYRLRNVRWANAVPARPTDHFTPTFRLLIQLTVVKRVYRSAGGRLFAEQALAHGRARSNGLLTP
jgi:hypothetical protein